MSATPPDRDARLESCLAAAFAAMESGEPVDLGVICAEHPELEKEVAAMLAIGGDLGALHRESARADRFLGTVIGGRYHVLERIGRGAAGSVYRTLDDELGREVALKLLDAKTIAGSPSEERFLREAEILAQHEHDNIVRIYDRGRTDDGHLFLVTELLEGVSLSSVLDAARDAMPAGPDAAAFARADWLDPLLPRAHREHGYLRQVVTWIAQLGRGLALAHSRGVFHRDVKPSNAFIRADGTAVLLDFGIAARVGDPALTLQTSVLGTPWYMAPEQARGRSEPSPTLDVYGLAATLYHLVTLRPPHGIPHEDASIAEVLSAARDRDPAPAASIHRGLAHDLAAILDVGLDPDPHRRYATAADMVADLSAFLDHLPVQARPLGPVGRLLRRVRRRPARAIAIAATTAAILLTAAVFPLAHSVRAASSARERAERFAHLPADLCIEGWPDQRLLVAIGERTRAIGELDRLLELEPEDLATRLLRASERLDAGRTEDAGADLRFIADHADSSYLRAVAERYASADSSRAGSAAVQLDELPDPSTPTDCFVAGFHALRARDTPRALDLLDRAIDYLPARDLRLLALLANGRWESAASEAHWLEGHFGRPTARTRHTLAAAALGSRHYEDAERFARDAIELRPDRHGPWNNLAFAQMRLGHLEDARASFTKAVAIRPWFDNSRAGLCQVLRSMERFDAARAEAKQLGAAWWREWELANVDLAEALSARRSGDDERCRRLANAAAAGFGRSGDDPDPGNLKRKAAPASIAFAEALAASDHTKSVTSLLAAMRGDPLNPTQILNLCSMLGNNALDRQTIDALRLWLCEVGLDVAPDDQRLRSLRETVVDSIRARSR